MRKQLLIFSLLCSTAVCAQKDSLCLPVHRLEGVEVLETRAHGQLASAVPLHTLSSSDFLAQGISNITDALNHIPGITVRDYGGAGGMKTVSVRGFSAKYTGVVYDGLALSDCQTGETDLSRYSLHSVSNISLIVGDGSDIFLPARQSAYPALLSIETASAAGNKAPWTGQLEGGSFGFVSPYLRYSRQLSKHFDLSAMGEYTYAENNYPYTLRNITEVIHQRRSNSRMNSGHGEVNVGWKPSPYSSWRMKTYYYDNDRLLPGIAKYYTTISGETLRDRNFFTQLVGTMRNRQGDWSLRVSGRFNWTASIYHDKLYAGGVNDASYWQREAYATATLLYAPTRCFSVDVASDYAFNNLNSSLATDTYPYRHSLWQCATAKYADERLTVLARLLYSAFFNGAEKGEQARDMNRLSPSLSLSYRLFPGKDIYVRASYKNIFRAPNFNENYYFHYGSATLKAETTDQFNLGLTMGGQTGSMGGQILIDAYYNHIKDMIVAVPYNMFVWTCINVGRVRSLGAELTLNGHYHFSDQQLLTVQGAYSYQRVTDRTCSSSVYYGYQIAYIPLHSGSMSVGWENPWVSISLSGSGVSSRWPNNSHYSGTCVPGYWLTGLTLWRKMHLLGCEWTVRGDLKNIFNKQYSIVYHYPMPGRSWMVSVKCEW